MSHEEPQVTDTDQERIAQAWSLRVHEGMSYRDVAGRLGVSVSTVHRWVGQAANAWESGATPDRHAQRCKDAATVDSWLSRGEALYDQGELGWPEFVRGAVPLLSHKAKLLGLYAPVRVAVEEPKRPPDPVLLEAMRLEAQRAGRHDEDETDAVLADDLESRRARQYGDQDEGEGVRWG